MKITIHARTSSGGDGLACEIVHVDEALESFSDIPPQPCVLEIRDAGSVVL